MLLKWFFLVSVFSIGLAQKNCNRPRVAFPAPVYGAGENLSSEGCGIWDKQKNGISPWYVVIRTPNGGGCQSTLLSPTSVLTHYCESYAKEFTESENRDDWKAEVGKCAYSSDEVKCVEDGEGQFLKIKSATKLNAPGYPFPLHIWKIENATLKENYIAPICISNKGNLRDFKGLHQYTAFDHEWDKDYQVSTKLSEDFGPCLSDSRNFQTCDKVHDNFLCARLSTENSRRYLSHQVNNRHFLRALCVEVMYKGNLFYYDIFPLLEQISSASGDIPLMPKTN